MLPLWARLGVGVMAVKRYSAFPKDSGITRASPSDCLVSYPGHSLEESYSSAEMQSGYFTAPADLAGISFKHIYLTHRGTMDQNGPGSNGNERVHSLDTQNRNLTGRFSYCQTQDTFFFCGRILLFYRGYSLSIWQGVQFRVGTKEDPKFLLSSCKLE